MSKRPDMSERPKARGLNAQRILRLMSILIGIGGITWIGILHYQRSKAVEQASPAPDGSAASKGPQGVSVDVTPPDNEAGTVDYDVDTLTGKWRKIEKKTGGERAITELLGPILDGRKINAQRFYYLLQKVSQQLPASDPVMKNATEVTLDQLLKDPDKYREMPVTVRGEVEIARTIEIGDNPSGISTILDGEIRVRGQGLCMFIASRPVALQKGQHVVLHGLFMQNVTRTTNDERSIESPFIVTSNPVALASEPPTGGVPVGAMVSVVALLFVLYFVMMFVLRRRQASRNPILDARRKVRQLMSDRADGTNEDDTQVDDEPGSGQTG